MSCESETIDVLRESGHKMTPQRMMILTSLRHAKGHLCAAEIFEQVKAAYPYVDISTVYRTLNVLKDMRLISETHMGGGDATFEWVGERAAPPPDLPEVRRRDSAGPHISSSSARRSRRPWLSRRHGPLRDLRAVRGMPARDQRTDFYLEPAAGDGCASDCVYLYGKGNAMKRNSIIIAAVLIGVSAFVFGVREATIRATKHQAAGTTPDGLHEASFGGRS